MLVRGGPTEGAVEKISDGVAQCPRAEVTSPSLGQVTVDFESLPVPELGDAAVALRYTATVTAPDGARTSVPVLLAVVEDGDRLMVLVRAAVPAGVPGGSGAPTAPDDPHAFLELAEDAYQAQAHALG
jgi:hypothetical protein